MRFALCLTGTKTIGHDPRNRRSRSRNPEITPLQGIGHDQRNDRSRSSGIPKWQAARDADRTAETLESWSDQVITQAGVHWLLSCVFLRFIEDNSLVDRPRIGGTPDSGRLLLAKDRHEAYFREHPLESDREYLLACFTEAGTLPGLHTFFDRSHNRRDVAQKALDPVGRHLGLAAP